MRLPGCGFGFYLGHWLCGSLGLRGRSRRVGSIEQSMLQSQGIDDAEQPDESDDFSQHHE
jgi:hypothetical protein